MISVVVPLYNEESCICELFERLNAVLSTIRTEFEIIFVNDGSTDNCSDILLEYSKTNRNVKVINFSRNFGHQAALIAGLDMAEGDAVITMDADLQHPPELIPLLISKWTEGYDIVYTIRKDNENIGILKNFTSNLFYSIINRLSETRIPQGSADFRLMDRSVVNAFQKLGERALFIRGLVSWVGFRQIGIPYEAQARFSGKSKYSVLKMLRLTANAITSFSATPLQLSFGAGILISILSFIYGLYAIYVRIFTNKALDGWASVIVVVLFLEGINLMILGLQGLYISRVFDEVKGRPRFLVRSTYGFKQQDFSKRNLIKE
jgi:polyisoprenyl-phosphate glycosyltransferase